MSLIDVLKSPFLDVLITEGKELDVQTSSYFDIENASEYHVKLMCSDNQITMSIWHPVFMS